MAGLIVQEWIEESGGAEQVLEAMRVAFPEARVACLWNDDPGRFAPDAVDESWLARTPLRGRKALALPLMSGTWRRGWGSAQAPDWVLASSYVFAHHAGFGTRAGVPKFSYVHTPARYLWEPGLDGRTALPLMGPPRAWLRGVDRRAAPHSGSLAANSAFVRDRIRRAWDRDARVIHPPVDAAAIAAVGAWAERTTSAEQAVLADLPDHGFLLAASRLVPYKRHAAVLDLGERLGLPVVIAGAGPERERLAALAADASVPVHVLGRVSDELMRALFQRALALVFPPVEDFGIIPVEAMAAGCPVIVNRVGGAAESVVDGLSGVHYDPDDPAGFRAAVDAASGIDPDAARRRALEFDTARFLDELRDWVLGGDDQAVAGTRPNSVASAAG
ncbi:glycosyltransferase involved in cell wall biosynthesis [Agromyces ramosus]|uniref:Glycosyltransferase involved in cell wall biosynthesis n=1 Tax=Agromyces ramosus TaxID=33879 RepID=A0A4Q7MJM0_9MICO|nr:glycosyltransferase [Agromyces ramosus]RZS68047.1 glycosyltransferase involved in cell wall biosynthesis [Agromyces ramosus]